MHINKIFFSFVICFLFVVSVVSAQQTGDRAGTSLSFDKNENGVFELNDVSYWTKGYSNGILNGRNYLYVLDSIDKNGDRDCFVSSVENKSNGNKSVDINCLSIPLYKEYATKGELQLFSIYVIRSFFDLQDYPTPKFLIHKQPLSLISGFAITGAGETKKGGEILQGGFPSKPKTTKPSDDVDYTDNNENKHEGEAYRDYDGKRYYQTDDKRETWKSDDGDTIRAPNIFTGKEKRDRFNDFKDNSDFVDPIADDTYEEIPEDWYLEGEISEEDLWNLIDAYCEAYPEDCVPDTPTPDELQNPDESDIVTPKSDKKPKPIDPIPQGPSPSCFKIVQSGYYSEPFVDPNTNKVVDTEEEAQEAGYANLEDYNNAFNVQNGYAFYPQYSASPECNTNPPIVPSTWRGNNPSELLGKPNSEENSPLLDKINKIAPFFGAPRIADLGDGVTRSFSSGMRIGIDDVNPGKDVKTGEKIVRQKFDPNNPDSLNPKRIPVYTHISGQYQSGLKIGNKVINVDIKGVEIDYKVKLKDLSPGSILDGIGRIGGAIGRDIWNTGKGMGDWFR